MRVVGEPAEHQRDRGVTNLWGEPIEVTQTLGSEVDLVQAQPAS